MDDLFARVRRLAEPGAAPDPSLLDLLVRTDDVTPVREAGRVLAGVDPALVLPPGRAARELRVAIVASFTADNVVSLLRVALLAAGIDARIRLTPPGQLLSQLQTGDSELARFAPDLTLCLTDDRFFLPDRVSPEDLDGTRAESGDRLAAFGDAVAAFARHGKGRIVLHTVPLSAERPKTLIAHEDRARLGRIWRELNLGLLDLAEPGGRVGVLDLETLLASTPIPLRDERLHRFAGMAWSAALEWRYAREAAGYARVVAGTSRKCLVVDLDNTLWGGVLGDDGPENIEVGSLYPGNAFVAMQRAVRSLRRQGVLVAVATKNDPDLVERVFAEHPGLLLRRGDFVAVKANWDAKDGSLAEIAAELNLGLDSFVFVDDSPFECELIREALPQVTVVRVDGDPADHVGALVSGGHFDLSATTDTDRRRTELYQAREQRQQWQESRPSTEDYLAGLAMTVRVRAADEYQLPRVVQLGARTNQFTLTGEPHSEQRTREMAAAPDCLVLAFEVEDRFGDEGVVGAVWIARQQESWLIENMVMSCRVFARGIEFAVLQTVAGLAADAGAVRLEAEFRSSGRNGPAKKFLSDAGFAWAPGVARQILPLNPERDLVPSWITLRHEERTTAHA
ncbi:HAD family hydrolase [Amycolatopsis sp. DSM 110486]|uniref:HAD-IIIC family phosphatase n=1 Tax=Amycolatopsis sp. DSM 110486 TaxID=2865832 RepID=UPI001C6A7CF9|nr:HAD-IIIC family phosphatase [Amycolatopsis sp. DSM 110486]QYN21269.1 HAD-IIIC family phosphatase [Amycolatopsis sp. DSM 110486]